MRKITSRLITNRHLLVLVVLLTLVAGLDALVSLPRIEDPRITIRLATIVTLLPGASAERVEALVTKKIEETLREVSQIETIRSTSRGGISVFTIELEDVIDATRNQEVFSEIRDRLADIEARLPTGASRPILDDTRAAVAFSLVVALAWDGPDEPRPGILGRLGDELADRLRDLAGTEQVVLFGAVDEEIRVTVKPHELAALGLTTTRLAERLAAADPKRAAGTMRLADREIALEVAGELDAAARVAGVPIRADDSGIIYVGDIADVTRTTREPPTEIAFADGSRAVLIGVRIQPAVYLDAWTRTARKRINEFASEVGRGVAVKMLFDQSGYTNARLADLSGNLGAGAVVIIAVVLVLMGWRAAIVVATALPLSIAITLFGLDLAGQQIHQMTIFGMIIAIGLLIDNAIVMTDQVHAFRTTGLEPTAAAAAAVQHLSSPLAASTFTTICGFLPIFLLPGDIGDFVRPIAIAVILALGASFVIAMTVLPALAALVVRPTASHRRWWRDGFTSRRLASAFRGLLGMAMVRPRRAVLACLIMPLAGFAAAASLGNQFFPAADRDQFEVQIWLAPGARIEETARQVLAIEAVIRAQGEVRQVSWVAGTSSPPVYYNQLRDQDRNPAYARGLVLATSGAEAKRLAKVLEDILAEQFPHVQTVIRPFGQGPPIPAPVSIRIVGPDVDRLRRAGETLREIMHKHPAVTDTRASIVGGKPELRLNANEEEAELAGLTLNAIADQYQSALEGTVGGRVLEGLVDMPVRVRYADLERSSTARIATLALVGEGENGVWLPTAALGEIELRPALASITRRDGERVNTVDAWIRPEYYAIDVTRDLQRQIRGAELSLAPDYRLEFAGESEEQSLAFALLLTHAPMLATIMFASLVLSFSSFTLAGLILFVAVLAGGLGLLALWLGGFPIGFNPLLGMAGLFGIAVNASIVVLAAIGSRADAAAGESKAIVEATLGSTRHIIATTLTTIGGFLPLLLLSGGDFWPPLAVVIAGGVGLSVTLGLVFTPAAYRLLAPLACRAR